MAAGLEILETEGLKALTLRAIAARVGVSHTAPKNHFGSLKGLLTAIGTEGFRRHAAFMRRGLSEASTQDERLRAAMEGYVAFAAEHPHLFGMMFSDEYCDLKNEALEKAARESYAVLAEISTGLDWDKAGLPGGQIRTEMMLWSMVHGYAQLAQSGQFRMGPDNRPEFGVADVIPAFSYKA